MTDKMMRQVTMRQVTMRQVTMRRDAAPGEERGRLDTCWVDCDRARVGTRVRSKEDGQIWTVLEIYGARLLSDLVSLTNTRRGFVETFEGGS